MLVGGIFLEQIGSRINVGLQWFVIGEGQLGENTRTLQSHIQHLLAVNGVAHGPAHSLVVKGAIFAIEPEGGGPPVGITQWQILVGVRDHRFVLLDHLSNRGGTQV